MVLMTLVLLKLAESSCFPAEADFRYFVAFVWIAAFKFMAVWGREFMNIRLGVTFAVLPAGIISVTDWLTEKARTSSLLLTQKKLGLHLFFSFTINERSTNHNWFFFFPLFGPSHFFFWPNSGSFSKPKEFEMDAASPIWSSSLSPPSPKENGPLNPPLWKIEINKNCLPGKKKILDN